MKVKILDNYVEILAEGLSAQLNRYKEFNLLTGEQEKAFEADDIDTVEDLLKRRQILMDEIDGLDKELEKIKGDICQILNLEEFSMNKLDELIDTPNSKKASGTIAEISAVLVEIHHVDTRNQRKLNEKFQDIKGELKKLHEGKHARQAYLDIPEQFPESRFFNQKK
ncbi:MAG: flagellar export chaperone FlgN [Thermincolia bacterium]